MGEVILPWEIDPAADRWLWEKSYIDSRQFPESVWAEPDSDHMVAQIVKLVDWLRGSRNWIVGVSQSPKYMRKLYSYLAPTWICTTGGRAAIVDVDKVLREITDPDSPLSDTIEYSDLIIIPYCDPAHPGLMYKRGALSSVLQRRKERNRPTLTDVYVRKYEQSGMDQEQTLNAHAKILMDAYGEVTYDLFSGHGAKYVKVQIPKGES